MTGVVDGSPGQVRLGQVVRRGETFRGRDDGKPKRCNVASIDTEWLHSIVSFLFKREKNQKKNVFQFNLLLLKKT